MDIISELEYFYDAQADKFYETRKKHWIEFDIILEEIKKFPGDKIKILEIGCGAGRFCKFLKENLEKEIDYTGIDLSKNLIKIAQADNKDSIFLVGEMNNFLSVVKQEEYDFVIAIASFQHLPDVNSRVGTLKNIYRGLKYGGKCIMINRSFSDWFKKKYKKAILKSFFKSVFSFGVYSTSDIYVPWEDGKTVFHRFYHIFSIGELTKLSIQSGFLIKNIGYVDKNGELSECLNTSRNSYLVLEKGVVSE